MPPLVDLEMLSGYSITEPQVLGVWEVCPSSIEARLARERKKEILAAIDSPRSHANVSYYPRMQKTKPNEKEAEHR